VGDGVVVLTSLFLYGLRFCCGAKRAHFVKKGLFLCIYFPGAEAVSSASLGGWLIALNVPIPFG